MLLGYVAHKKHPPQLAAVPKDPLDVRGDLDTALHEILHIILLESQLFHKTINILF